MCGAIPMNIAGGNRCIQFQLLSAPQNLKDSGPLIADQKNGRLPEFSRK
jgi:hypothetical protein